MVDIAAVQIVDRDFTPPGIGDRVIEGCSLEAGIMLVHIDHSRGNFHGEFGNIETWDYNTGMLLPVEIEPQVSRTGPTGRNDTCNGSGALLVEKHAFNPAVVGFIAFESGPVVIGMPPRGSRKQ